MVLLPFTTDGRNGIGSNNITSAAFQLYYHRFVVIGIAFEVSRKEIILVLFKGNTVKAGIFNSCGPTLIVYDQF
ncbi:MAG: hypothetical protein BWX77_00069 [Bacteroidetes bacterium ADurb.Bin090]|nr:MAG: hypothetical protein BWX77_00069 [Bacteroidetes bacterium ADurb.Bin090]